jgi:transcriptional regulator with XRE-family HTH domain
VRDLELGRLVRALRRRRRWRQEDCAVRARVHRSTWSNLERGRIGVMSLRTLRDCLEVLGVDLDLVVRGDRARFDRLLDERHAAIETRWTTHLRAREWRVWVEHSFSHFGERGRVDLVCWHAGTRTLGVVEVKTELADSQELLGGLDVKVRLAPVLARELGLPAPAQVVPILIFEESMTNRRRVARLAPLFARFSLRGRTAIAWLGRPAGAVTGILLFSGANPSSAREPSAQRARRRRRSSQSAEHEPAPGGRETMSRGSQT